ncbi:MAG: site-specific DNA-methyltransferase [Lachnospiraceae bacterium]|nr:site-specific DNA-methyltransferase [Lachnospiraceae bacterium]
MANKLELTWYGKEEPIQVEPRLLIENTSLSNTAFDPETENRLIHGDNLLSLKALEHLYAGQVKCIYIDPPYNTGSAFEHYDDNLEHSQWLNLMRPRLEILWNLLLKEGSIWISIDDDERDYLKVLCDEVFGRDKFLTSIIWQKRYSRENREAIGDSHEYILIYVKNRDAFKEARNYLPLTEKQMKAYSNPDNDPRGPWQSVSLLAQGFRPNQMYTIIAPNGKHHTPPAGNCWKVIESEYRKALEDNRITFGNDGNGVPRRKQFLKDAKGLVPWTWWPQDEVGHTGESKNEVNALFGTASFDTPKPERLIERIFHIATNPGDLVLDSFLGSGTTAAVAHKMGRRYIGIEMGDHAYTHCKVRLDKVIAGEDKGGVTKSTGWQSGGGYRFYELAPTLIKQDAFGEYVINSDYDADMLAAAVALHEKFTYQPDTSLFWKQSFANENSYLFVTTRHLNRAYLDLIHGTMGENEYLVIACRSYDNGLEKAYDQITIKKIPQMLMSKCEFGKTDYNLNIVHPPVYEDEEETDEE